jgi:hypothetical protein
MLKRGEEREIERARRANEPVAEVTRSQAEFQKRLDDLGVHASMAFVLLQATKEQLIELDESIYEELIQGTKKAKSLVALMEMAELRYAELMLSE